MFFKKPFDYEKMLLKYVDEDFSLFACGKDAPKQDVLNKFEKRWNVKLPTDFKKYSISALGGLNIEVKDDIWPRPKQSEVGPFWSFLYGLEVFGFAIDIPEWMDINIQTDAFTSQTNKDYIPFMKIIGDADVYCFNKTGIIYRWDHELDIFKKVERSFNELLEYETAELRSRKDKKKQQTLSL